MKRIKLLNLISAFSFGVLTLSGCGNQPQDTTTSKGIAVPEISTDYVLIYKPQPDVYTLRSTKNYKNGETYYKWQPNDHSFIRDENGRWHCFGITRPDDVLEDDEHEAGGQKFHALAPEGTLEQAFTPETWIDQPKIVFGGAPYVLKIEDRYHFINSAYEHLTSTNLYDWKKEGKLKIKREKGKDTRDPNVLYWNGTYYMVNCNDRSINLVTSTDFENWSDPVDIYVAPKESWRCESPSMVVREGKFYLFWCLWDDSDDREQLLALYKDHTPWSYDYRTFVLVSDTPTDFMDKQPIAQLKAHAPEIIQDEKGNWFISSADYPNRGINLARLNWK